MKEKWKYSNAAFDADKYNDTILRFAPWSGHRNFGYDFIQYYEPAILVELGSHYGCSAFTFMQAIKDNHLNTQLYLVDLWEAIDVYTEHSYEQDVYSFFMTVLRKEFNCINSTTLKMSFDNANTKFENNTIDILHIDGSHEYQDVKHDFELWLPKLKDTGIILFHDISDQKVLGRIMGSCKFWKEIKHQFQWTVEMQYSWGLGILFLSKDIYIDFVNKVDLNYYLKMDTYEEDICKDKIRKDYFKIQDLIKWIDSLKTDKVILEQDNGRIIKELNVIKKDYEQTIEEKEKYIIQLEKERNVFLQEIQKIENNCRQACNEKKFIEQYNDRLIKELKKIQWDYEQTIEGKEKYIIRLERERDVLLQKIKKIENDCRQVINDKKFIDQDNNRLIEEIKKIKQDYELTINEKNDYINELETSISYYKFIIREDKIELE